VNYTALETITIVIEIGYINDRGDGYVRGNIYRSHSLLPSHVSHTLIEWKYWQLPKVICEIASVISVRNSTYLS